MTCVQGTGLPFNRYSWLTTHNSFAVAGAVSPTGSPIIAPPNQEDTVTAQLKVRLSGNSRLDLHPSRTQRPGQASDCDCERITLRAHVSVPLACMHERTHILSGIFLNTRISMLIRRPAGDVGGCPPKRESSMSVPALGLFPLRIGPERIL